MSESLSNEQEVQHKQVLIDPHPAQEVPQVTNRLVHLYEHLFALEVPKSNVYDIVDGFVIQGVDLQELHFHAHNIRLGNYEGLTYMYVGKNKVAMNLFNKFPEKNANQRTNKDDLYEVMVKKGLHPNESEYLIIKD